MFLMTAFESYKWHLWLIILYLNVSESHTSSISKVATAFSNIS